MDKQAIGAVIHSVRKEAVCSKRQVKEVSQASKTPSRTRSQEPSLATTLEYSSDRDDNIDCVHIDGGPSDSSPQAYMAYRRECAAVPRAARNVARDSLPPGGDRTFGV